MFDKALSPYIHRIEKDVEWFDFDWMRTDFVSCGCQLNCVIHNLWKHSRPTLQIGTFWDNIWCFAYFVLYNSEHPRTQQMKSSAEMHTYRMSKKYRFLEWYVSYGCQILHLVGQFTPISPAVRVRGFGWKKTLPNIQQIITSDIYLLSTDQTNHYDFTSKGQRYRIAKDFFLRNLTTICRSPWIWLKDNRRILRSKSLTTLHNVKLGSVSYFVCGSSE